MTDTPIRKIAKEVIRLCSISDLNQEEPRRVIRALADLALGNQPTYPESYTAETLCPNCGDSFSGCDCGLDAMFVQNGVVAHDGTFWSAEDILRNEG